MKWELNDRKFRHELSSTEEYWNQIAWQKIKCRKKIISSNCNLDEIMTFSKEKLIELYPILAAPTTAFRLAGVN